MKKTLIAATVLMMIAMLHTQIMAQEEEAAPKQDADAMIYKACYLRCLDKVEGGVIARAEGMACMALCLSDNLNTGGKGAARGRLYLKFADGHIEKGLRVPVRLISLDFKPEKAPDNFDEQKKGVVDLLNNMLTAKKTAVCGKPEEYPACGYNMESTLGLMTVWQDFTDIDTGMFTINGLPDGNYALWVDWYRTSPNDPNTGALYRWLIPFKVGEQKSLSFDINDSNISFILNNFSRAFFAD